jgi:hypothetical protein
MPTAIEMKQFAEQTVVANFLVLAALTVPALGRTVSVFATGDRTV